MSGSSQGTLATARAWQTQLLPRVQASAADTTLYARYQLARLGTAGQAGLAALGAALILGVSALVPLHHHVDGLRLELARLRSAPAGAARAHAAGPRLLASLPSRAQVPTVIGQVFAQAKAAGVPLDTGHYTYVASQGASIARFELEFPVKARYPDIRSFIDRTLAAVPAATLAKLRLERKAVADAIVSADVRFVVFVRTGERP